MKQYWKKILSWTLAGAMSLTMLPGVGAHAEEAGQPEEAGVASTTFEPWKHGYRFVDILNFDPASDPYAEEMVAKIPLQKRNDTFAATQANPDLSDDSKLYVISSGNYRSTDVAEAPWNANMSYEEFSYNLFKFWQYTDMIGAGGRPTQSIAIGSADKEYGIIAVPMAAATNAAHKNGVISIAEYFIPRTPQYTEEWLYKDEDGNFPYAQKLVELAQYYGFDGYFINQEESIPSDYVPLFREMLKWMRDQGLYIQWYDSITESGGVSYQNAFNSRNSGWIWNETDGRVTDSIFLNYWYGSTALRDSKALAEQLGLDPYEVVFMGVEGGQWQFGTDIETRYNAVDENGKPYTSFAIWGSDWYHEQFHKPNGRYSVGYQWEAEERERIYYTSATENAGEYSTGTVQRDDIGYSGTINFQGFSKYISEKSVINGTTFASNFNNGHGMQYFLNGKVSRDMEWTNLNLQDILPTWQWWVESTDENRLELDWDYGSKFYRLNEAGETYAFPYTQIGAFNGGSSLVMYGDVQGSQTVNLYKTELDVTATSKLALTYNKPSADDGSKLQVAVILKNGETDVETVYLPIENAGKKTDGWATAELDLSAYAGRTIAAIALELSAEEKVEGYQLNLGRLAITDGTDMTPAAPEGLTLLNRFDSTGEIQIGWTLGDYETVKNYHVYAGYADGTERFVGGAFASNYYIKTLEDAENVTCLKVRAVAADGSESEAAVLNLEKTNRVSNIRTVSQDNKLNVTWEEPEASFEKVEVSLNYWYSETTNEAQTVTAAKGEGKTSLDIALEDGAQYILTVATVNADGSKNEAVSYFGDLADKYCQPYDGEARVNPSGQINLTAPAADDWAKLYMEVNGNTTTYVRLGGNAMRNISVPQTGLATMVITLEDMDGNTSRATTLLFVDGKPASADMTYDETMIPDAVLRAALQEKVGKTLADLIGFEGALDLSGLKIADLTGLNLLTGITELNLGGTDLTVLDGSILPSGLTKLDLTGSKSLTKINLDNRSLELVLSGCTALTNLSLVNYSGSSLDLSDCVNITDLDVTGTTLTTLNIEKLTKLHNFRMMNSQISELVAADVADYTSIFYWNWQNAKLDLSETTAEGKLMAGIKNFFATSEPEDEIDANVSALYNAGNWNAQSGETKVIDMGSAALLSSLTYTNTYTSWYGNQYSLLGAEVAISNDGENYETIVTFTDEGNESNVTISLPEGTSARYIRLTNTGDNRIYTGGWTVNGYAMAPKGFTYDGQQPAIVRDDVKTLRVADNGAEYQMLDLLAASYASAKLVKSGTLASTLAEADWIDTAYLSAQYIAPKGVRVNITDPNGNAYVIPVEGPTLGEIDRENKVTVQKAISYGSTSAGEGAEMLFDGDPTSKWCTTESNKWLGFELTEPAVIGAWYTLHAGSESSAMISGAFRLQVLNTEVMSEEEYLALSDSEKRDIIRADANWKDLDVVTGNSDNEVTREVELDSLATAQVYRFVVDQSGQPGGQTWGALRVYEMSLYAYTGQLGESTNGRLKADDTGLYQVEFVKTGSAIANTTVQVDHAMNWLITKMPTCTEEGVMEGFCFNCGHTEHVRLAALGHDHNYDVKIIPATETTPGSITRTCSRCDEVTVHELKYVAFTDISGHWAESNITTAAGLGLFYGATDTTFSPEATLTRGQLVAVLYRMAGAPAVDVELTFEDVKADAYYADAIAWAFENKIAYGMNDTTFAPDAPVTREQLAAFVARYAMFTGVYEETNANLGAFTDAGDVTAYAAPYMNWAVANGIVSGYTNGKLMPAANATRAQAATMILRYFLAF